MFRFRFRFRVRFRFIERFPMQIQPIELLLPLVLGCSVHFIRQTVIECLSDEAINTHVFKRLNFHKKSHQGQTMLVTNLSCLIFTILFILVLAIIPFQTFTLYSFQQLYVIIQIWTMCWYTEMMSRTEKSIYFLIAVVYLFVSSMVLDMFAIYAIFNIQLVLTVEAQLYSRRSSNIDATRDTETILGKRFFSAKVRRILKLADKLLLICVWVSSLTLFLLNPSVVDTFMGPCVFWVHYTIQSQNKKKI